MSNYTIVDEPAKSRLDYLIINPNAILFASVIIPILVQIPAYGRIWLPALVFILNGFLLSSPSRWRETFFALLSIGCWFGLVFGGLYCVALYLGRNAVDTALPYLRIVSQAGFYFCLIYVASLQLNAFAIYQYINRGDKA